MENWDLDKAKGDVFLGLDAGSTTTKAVLIDADKKILYSWYMPNQGSPLNSALEIVKDMYARLPTACRIKAAARF